jgi:Fe-S-cluster containining protein
MPLPRLPKPRREDLRPGECLCDHCTAKCCRYFALPIDTPESREEYDYIRWYLLHQQASIFVDDGTWYLLIHTPCRHLQPNNLCEIYDSRPQICREYTTENCEYEDSWTYQQYFETPEQFNEYCEAIGRPSTIKGQKRRKGIRSPKPVGLPMV